MFNYAFPIETINRELDAKVMVAVNVVDEKSRVYLGQHDYLHQLIGRMRHGVYFGKNCFRSTKADNIKTINQLKDRDFRIFYLHEEGAVFPSEGNIWHAYMTRQYDPSLLKADDAIFVWGEAQREFDRTRLGEHPVPVEAVGHPRFDLYKDRYRGYYTEQVAKLRERFGSYVLLNTNFGLINTVTPWSIAIPRARTEKRFTQLGAECFRFLDLIFTLLEEFPDTRFVVRSHPSENDATYQQLFNKYKNVHVCHEGPVAPWIFAADCLVHAGCTTSLEAWFAGVPSLNYSALAESHLTTETSIHCHNAQDVVRELRNVLSRPDGLSRPALSERSRQMLKNIDADALDVLSERLRQANDGAGEGLQHARLHTNRQQRALRDKVANARSRLSSRHRARRAYDSKKFPGLDRQRVDDAVLAANQILSRRAVVTYFDPMLVVLGV